MPFLGSVLNFCRMAEDVCSDGPSAQSLAPDELNVSNGETPKYGDTWCQVNTCINGSTSVRISASSCDKKPISHPKNPNKKSSRIRSLFLGFSLTHDRYHKCCIEKVIGPLEDR
jgi:hypothetical protein